MLKCINIKKKTPLFGLIIALFLSGCGESEVRLVEHSEPLIRGKLIDSVVQGVEYRCGNFVKFTDSNGTFLCSTLPVSFYIGAIQLGKIHKLPNDKQIFPQDLADVNRSDVNNSQVLKLALLFQSLDNDSNASNGIVIDEKIADMFTQEIIVENLSLEVLKEKIQEQHKEIVFQDLDEVVTHLRGSLGLSSSSSENNTTTATSDTNNRDDSDSTSSNTTTASLDSNSNSTSSDINNLEISDISNTQFNQSINTAFGMTVMIQAWSVCLSHTPLAD